ncbi:2OG-Fe(II) oxygenase family protein [Variovorax sp. LjRoot290]|uniref:2OG-Fe(II) oxygenase family protein n=1 Tax=unclassified Variovorax TaxID=663243 RepID=UPI003ECFC1E1
MVKESNRWMEASDVIPMFPSLVWKIQFEAGLRDALARSILAALADMRRGLPPLEAGRGWQSGQALHEREDFRELVSCVRRGVTSILRFLRFLRIGDAAFEITAYWATVLAKGAAHKIHSHPNNFLSGVYYVCTPPGADAINFHDPRRQTAVIRPPVVELTADNTDQVVVKVRKGTLLMFPSFLEHSVDANLSEEERISVSFNVMFSSFTQQLSKPLW